jgi:hypothetical protein
VLEPGDQGRGLLAMWVAAAADARAEEPEVRPPRDVIRSRSPQQTPEPRDQGRGLLDVVGGRT